MTPNSTPSLSYAEKLFELFAGNPDCHGVYRITGQEESGKLKGAPLPTPP